MKHVYCLVSIAFVSVLWISCNKESMPPVTVDNGLYEVSVEIREPAEFQNHILEFGQPHDFEVYFKTSGDDKIVQRVVVELLEFGASVFDPKVVLETFIDQTVNEENEFTYTFSYTPERHQNYFIHAYTTDSNGVKGDSSMVSFWVQDIVAQDFPIAVGLITMDGNWEGTLEVTDASSLSAGGNYNLFLEDPGSWSIKIEVSDANGNLIQTIYDDVKDGEFQTGGFCCYDLPFLPSGNYSVRTVASRLDGSGLNAAIGQLNVN